MDAVEYMKIKERLCISTQCVDCPLRKNNAQQTCGAFERKQPIQAVEIIENWSKEHPVKTYLSVLLEKFPNIKINNYGFITSVCPHNLFKQVKKPNECIALSPINVCKDCWNREYMEEE